MKKYILLLLIPVSFFLYKTLMKDTTVTIPPSNFKSKIEKNHDATILDVRTAGEFSEGHLENALNIDWNESDFDQKIEKINKKTTIFVYCQSGGRSSSAVSHLHDLGYKNIFELDGGISSWQTEGLPVQ